MAINWGAWDYSGSNGMRVGIELTKTSVTTSSSSITWTIKVYTENEARYDDNQTLTLGGNISGTVTYDNSSSGGAVLRTTESHTYNYTTYGSSPGTRTFTAAVSGTYNGSTPSVSVKDDIPARPYAAPSAPTGVTNTRNSDTQATVTWTNVTTAQKPYTSLTVQMSTFSGTAWGSYVTVATTSSTAKSYVKTGLTSNKAYRFQVRSNNSVGSSAYVVSGIIYMTPDAPSSPASVLNANNTITTTWKNNHYDGSNVTLEIQRSVAGGAYANVVTGLSRALTTWTDNTPGAGTNSYRIRATTSAGPLYSAYATAPTVSTIVPPLAPTLLSPNGTRVDLTTPTILTWKHNPGGDNAAQTQYSIDYSSNGGTTWQALPSATAVASTASTHTIAANVLPNSVTTYQWRVSTKGVAAAFSPVSSAATFTGNLAPVVTITAPAATTIALPLSVTWTYTQPEGSVQSAWQATLYEDTGAGGLRALEPRSGTGTTLTTTFDYPVTDGVSYVVQVRSQSAGGQWSNLASQATVINLPDPAEPVVEGEYQLCTGTVVLSLAQLAPLAGEININTVALERRAEGGDWVRLAEDLVLPQSGPADRVNLVTNPSVEVDATGFGSWYGVGGAGNSGRQTTGGTSGTGFFRQTWTTGTATTSCGPYFGLRTSGVMPVTAGKTYSFSVDARVSKAQRMRVLVEWYDAAGNPVTPSNNGGPEVVITANTWTRLSITATAPLNATRCLFGPYSVSGTGYVPWVAGDYVDLDSLLVEESATVGSYFSGSTDSTTNWTGTANASTSRMRVGPSDAVDFIDPVPLTHGINEYQVIATSTAPSYRVSEIIEVEGTDGVAPYSCDGLWAFLSYGPAFENVLRVKHSLSAKESAGRVRSAASFLGRAKPVLLAGANKQRVVGVSGSLYFDRALTPDPGCRDDSPPNDWLTASQEAVVVAYRDYTGRRIFGMLSDVDTSDGLPGISSISFSVTEVDYVETYG